MRRTSHGAILVGIVRNSIGGASVVWTVKPSEALVLIAQIMPQLAEAAAAEKAGAIMPPGGLTIIGGGE